MITLNDVNLNDLLVDEVTVSNLTTANFARGKGDKDKRKRQIKRGGRWWTPNQVTTATRPGKKNAVLASKKINGVVKYKLLNFGATNYGHNYSTKARNNFNARFAGIKKKDGTQSIKDKFSPAYWSKKILWSKNTKPVGSGRFDK